MKKMCQRIGRFESRRTALLAVLLASASPAAAQQADAGATDDGGVETIVVTAQKRAQNVQDVPIAITALGGARLESAPVDDIADLFAITPGVSGSANSTAQPLVAIRGIVSNDFSIGADPALGVYIDEVYTGRSAGAVQELIDIERVETIRGPQGTLLGRNTTAGAISIFTPKPSLSEVSGRLGAAYGNNDYREFSGVLNTPLSETTGFRASAVMRKRDGVFENFDGREVDTLDRLAGRAALRLRPDSDLDIIFTADGERDREDGTAAKSISFPIPGDPNFGTVKGVLGLNALDRRSDRDKYGFTLRAEVGLGDYSLTSISAARGYLLRYLEDTDGTPLTQVHFRLREEQDALSQELRLSSPDEGGFRWFVGASVYREKVSARSQAIYDEDAVCTGLAGAPVALNCDTVLRLTPSPDPAFGSVFQLLDALGAISDPYVGATGQIEANSARGNYLSWGLYGDATVELTNSLELILGARFSSDRKRINLAAAPVVNTLTLVNGGNVFLRAGTQQDSETWRQLQPRVVLNWQPTDDTTVYASATRGYKSGGFNVLQPGDPAFDPEKVTSYEIGTKASLLDRALQLELAGFHWRYSDLQVQVFEGGLPLVRNAGKARAYGLEASAIAALSDGFDVNAAITLLDAKYQQFTPQPGVDFSGNRPALAPEFTANLGASYSHEFAGGGTLNARTDYTYQSKVFFSPDNTTLRENGFSLVSARLAYTFPSDRFEIALRGDNLTNERYATSGQAIDAINLAQLRAGAPRHYALELIYRW